MIELLYVEGCPSAGPTEALLRRILAEERCSASLRRIAVGTPEEAIMLQFPGSPTIRVNGRDIEPDRADESGGALSCRLYQTEHGSTGVPPAALIQSAMRRLMTGGGTPEPGSETTPWSSSARMPEPT
jgi:hypothetical protein